MYRKFGKDPTKFRPSAEALIRRVIKEKNLYRVNDLVDLNNLYSIKTGYCIGNYDLDKIKGNIIYDKSENNAYLTISRGMINISGIYALKDDLGEFGNSTSDSLRTSIDENSKKILIVIYDFYQKENAILLAEQLIKLLEDNIKISKIKYEVRVKDEAN
jgi:DNA/RNA-binding domain of Phe-tRNA-synthetase-like protein